MKQIPDFSLFGETAPFPDVVHAETFLARAPAYGWTITPHQHSNLAQVFVVTSGHVQAKVEGAVHDLSGGTFLYVPVQTVHDLKIDPHTDGAVLSFPLPVLASVGPTSSVLASALGQVITGVVDRQLDVLMGALISVVEDVRPFRQQVAVGLAHGVLGMLAGLAPAAMRTPADKRLAQLDGLIREHQIHGWGAARYAEAMRLTTGHLSRLCRDATGMGARAYIDRATMEEACRMLAFTRMTVADIGYRLGFGDPSYFSKRFRTLQGQTPSDYRRHFEDGTTRAAVVPDVSKGNPV